MTIPKLDRAITSAELKVLLAEAGEASELLKALSHETRLIILCLLAEQEMSVSEIESIVGLPQATVSQQLARLRLDKLVISRRDGRTIYYRLGNSKVLPVIEVLYEVFCKPVRANQTK